MIKKMLAVLTIAVALAASSAVAASAVEVVKARNNDTWGPDRVKAEVREKIVWKNPTVRQHIVRATSGDWDKNSRISTGERTITKFSDTGIYVYKCPLHQGMRGRIIVV